VTGPLYVPKISIEGEDFFAKRDAALGARPQLAAESAGGD
jgi:hypothetical protein